MTKGILLSAAAALLFSIAAAQPAAAASTTAPACKGFAQGVGVWEAVRIAWYAFKYQVCDDQVWVNKAPHDCDYYTAPLGNKNCHYEEQAVITKVSVSTDGRSIYSTDGGKSWAWNTSGLEPHVTVWWKKVED